MRAATSPLNDERAVAAAIAAVAQVSTVPADIRTVAIRETVRSRLIFLARAGARQPSYCLKLRKPEDSIPPIHRRTAELSPSAEFEMTLRAYEHFSRRQRLPGSIARPVAFLCDHEAILSEYAPGHPLKDRLPWRANALTALLAPSLLHRIAETCGVWLKTFHEIPPLPGLAVYPLDSEILRRRVLQALDGLPEAVLRHLPLERMMESLQKLDSHDPRPAVVGHGDFHPGNILVSKSRITVVDVATAGLRSAEDDLAFFITLMFAQKPRIVLGAAAGTSALIRGICDSFLAGYGYAPADGGWSRLQPMMVVHVAERLAQVSASIGTFPGAPQRILIMRLASWAGSELPWLLR